MNDPKTILEREEDEDERIDAMLDMVEAYDDGPCSECGGTGYIITCPDDICVGSDHCIHGDGEQMCPHCNGQNYI